MLLSRGLGSLRGIARQEKTTFQQPQPSCICQFFTLLLILSYTTLVTVNGMAVPDLEDDPNQPAEGGQIGNPSERHHHQHSMKIMPGDDEEAAAVARAQESRPASLPRMQAVELLLEKYKQISGEQQEQANERAEKARALWSQDFERRASELCGTSASLECGKRILSVIEGQEGELSVHMKCDLRDDFLKCIDTEKKGCLELAKSSVLPELPPKDVIKAEQSKLWKVLWTAGGCVLANY